MSNIWRDLRAWGASHRAELRLGVRVVVAGVAAYAVAQLLGLAQGFWAVITAVLVMQASIGGSLKASFDRLVGTIGGAIYGGLLAALIPHNAPTTVAIVLALALAPLAVLAAIDARFRVAPLTAVILLLIPAGPGVTPLAVSLDRILEVAIGSVLAVLVALVVLPARAHQLVGEAASRLLFLLADLLPLLLGSLPTGADQVAVNAMNARTRKALTSLDGAAEEAQRERRSHLTDAPDPDPIVRTAMRLRNDLTMIARATAQPLPEPLLARLAPSIGRISAAGAAILRGTAAAFAARSAPPALGDFDSALQDFSAAIAAIRRERMTQDLPIEAVGRLFALGFALEQFRQDLGDMTARALEFVASRPVSLPSVESQA